MRELALAAVIAAAPPAAGSPASFGPIVDPQWDDLKVYAGELQKYFPAEARARGESGAAAVECIVSAKGALENCRVLKEEPEAKGFGEAAVKVASRFKMKTVTRSGAPAPGRVIRIPIAFNFVWSPQPISERPSFNITVSPRWVRHLDAQALAREYPPEAVRADREGDAAANCEVLPDGHLSACTLLSEQPADYHFGDATMKLVAKMQLDVNDAAAKIVVGKRITVPIRFRLPSQTDP